MKKRLKKNTMRILFLLTGIICCLAATSCQKANIRAGEASLEGIWRVTEIRSSYGTRVELGTEITEEFTESGTLGTFEFSEEEVSYSYTRLDTLYENTATWQLERERVNEGFTKVEKYTLTLDNEAFVCEFGDQTQDAERDAEMLYLIFETGNIYPYERIDWLLKKE